METAIWWIKRDFRLNDNDALDAALKCAQQVLPVFVFEPDLIAQPDYSAMHVHAWHQALYDLRTRLIDRGSNVYIATGNVLNVFTQLYEAISFDAVFSHEETGTHWTFERDIRVAHWCHQRNIAWEESHQNAVIRRLQTRDDRQPVFQQRLINTPTVLLFEIRESQHAKETGQEVLQKHGSRRKTVIKNTAVKTKPQLQLF